MTLEEQLAYIKEHFPEAWKYLLDVDDMKITLPSFDDNDKMYFEQKPKERRKMPTSEHFSAEELSCHCCGRGVEKIHPRLLELLEQLRADIGPIEISCAYCCPAHNAEMGGEPDSQHVLGTAADVLTPNYGHCHTPRQLFRYCERLPFDGIKLYDWGVHVDVRHGGIGSRIHLLGRE